MMVARCSLCMAAAISCCLSFIAMALRKTLNSRPHTRAAIVMVKKIDTMRSTASMLLCIRRGW